MNYRDLKYFVAVAELKHFGKAAEACFVSQPTLSVQLKKLEEELGVCLFERNKKQVLITPEGETLVQQAKAALAAMSRIKQQANSLRDPLTGSLRLGLIPSLSPYLLPHITPILREQLPELDLLFYEEKTEMLLKQLRQGDIDAAMLALPVDTKDLVVQTLFEEPFYLAISKQHRLAAKKTVNLEDLVTEKLLLLDEGHCLRDQALEVCFLAGAQERLDMRATSLETLRHMVIVGAGITLLPALSLHPPLNLNLCIVPFEQPMPSRTAALVWRKESHREACLQTMAEIVQAAIADKQNLLVLSK